MNTQYRQVREFHKAFGHPAPGTPRPLEKERAGARAAWMREEVEEFIAASNIYEQADAMIDLIYFALGTLVEMGVAPDAAFDIVHAANMTKLWPDGKPRFRADGKAVKPRDWQDPEPLLREYIDTLGDR